MFAGFNPKMLGTKFSFLGLSHYPIKSKYLIAGADYDSSPADFACILIFTDSTGRNINLPDKSKIAIDKGWWCIVQNSGTSNSIITLQPGWSAFASDIDDITQILMYPGEIRLVYCNGDVTNNSVHGTTWGSIVLRGFRQVWTATTTFTVPPGYIEFDIEMIGGGGSGASRATTGNAGGGGSGGYCRFTIPASAFVDPGSTETVTVAGTAAGVSGTSSGNVGNVTSITIDGVTYSTIAATAATSAGSASAANGGGCGMPPLCTQPQVLDRTSTLWNGKDAANNAGQNSAMYGPSGGGVTSGNVPHAGGDGMHGPGAGGGSSTTAGGLRNGGASLLAGAGGAGGATDGTGVANGVSPGGGGGGTVQGATSGSGAGGRVYIIGRI